MSERLEQLEIKVAYLEQANAELSDIVYRQKLELDALRERLVGLVGRMEAAQAAPWPAHRRGRETAALLSAAARSRNASR